MRGRLTALPLAKSLKAVRIAAMQSGIGSRRFTSSSVMMMVTALAPLSLLGPQAHVPEKHALVKAGVDAGFPTRTSATFRAPIYRLARWPTNAAAHAVVISGCNCGVIPRRYRLSVVAERRSAMISR